MLASIKTLAQLEAESKAATVRDVRPVGAPVGCRSTRLEPQRASTERLRRVRGPLGALKQ